MADKFLFLCLLSWLFLAPTTLAQQIQPVYQTLATNGSNSKDTTWAVSLPKVATDSQYLYTLVMAGNNVYQQTVEVKRQRLDSQIPATTIWSKSNQFSSIGGLIMDNQGKLHVFYFSNYSDSVYWSALLKEDVANSPQSTTVTFSTTNIPTAVSGVCNRCRLGLHYDDAADTIHLVYDQTNTGVNPNIVQAYYTQKINNGSWSPLNKILDYYFLPDGKEQGFYYPVMRVFGNKIHVFFTGSIYDALSPSFTWFNGIRHYYKDLSSSTWSNEWLTGPFTTDKTYIVGNDSYITPDNKLVVIAPYVENLGLASQKLSLLSFTSDQGLGNWQQREIYNSNVTACVTQTANGNYNLFFSGSGAFLNWGRSQNGQDWIFTSFQPPTGYIGGLDANCLEDTIPMHKLAKPTVMVAGYNQTIGQNTLADGHSLVLATIDPLPGDLDGNNVVNLADLQQAITQLNIFLYNQVVANFGK